MSPINNDSFAPVGSKTTPSYYGRVLVDNLSVLKAVFIEGNGGKALLH
jgi:hypothetical protein